MPGPVAPRRRRFRLPGILPEPAQVRLDDRPLDERDLAVLSDLQVHVDDAPPADQAADEEAARRRSRRLAAAFLWGVVLLGALLLVGMAIGGMRAENVRSIEYWVYGLLLAVIGVALLRRLRRKPH